MTIKAQINEMVDRIPDSDLPMILEIIRRFVPVTVDDIASADDLKALDEALKEYAAGEAISHSDVWR